MQREPIESSSIASIGYDPDTTVLEIEFRNGRIYQFFDVPPTLAAALRAAPSHGAFFNNFVRNGGYAYRVVTPER